MQQTTSMILCGGKPTRIWLWRSRAAKLAAFVHLLDDWTLFEMSIGGCLDVEGFTILVVMTGYRHHEYLERRLGDTKGPSILIVPQARDTAGAIALAAYALPDDAIILVYPGDHHLCDDQVLVGAVGVLAELAEEGAGRTAAISGSCVKRLSRTNSTKWRTR